MQSKFTYGMYIFAHRVVIDIGCSICFHTPAVFFSLFFFSFFFYIHLLQVSTAVNTLESVEVFTPKMSTGDLMILSAVCFLLPCIIQAKSKFKRLHIICGWLGRAMVLGSFQCRGVLLLWHIVGQGPAVLAAGAG